MNAPLDRRFLLGGLAGAAGVSALTAMARGGPINPPSGAIGSTGKTLTEVEPRIALSSTNTPGDADSVYKITQAGGYYLTANMLVPTGKNAIKIAASGVTLDLNGFMIAGFGGLGGIIPSSTAVERITIRNGTIVSLPYGVLFTDVPDVTVENVRFEAINGYAVRTGDRGVVRGCTVVSCGGGVYAVRVEDDSLVEGCTISQSSGWGLSTHFGSRVIGCIISDSSLVGATGSGLISGCVFHGNGSSGVQWQEGAVIGCAAISNGGIGISIDQGMVIDCESTGNEAGIRLNQRSLVRGCTCTLNNGAGIAVGFFANHIERNTCIENDTGISAQTTGVSGGRNIITGNTCIDNRVAAFNIAAGNVCYVVTAATTAAFSGSAGGVSPGTTSAWANLAL